MATKILLIVEDDPYVQRMYRRLFTLNNYDVVIVGNGEEGLRLAKEKNPQMILLDIMMPGINGLQVLEELKTDVNTKAIPVIMLTNYGDEQIVGQASKMGASGFIIKSNFSPDEVKNKVKEYLKQVKE